MELLDDDYCFACGAKNQTGLHLTFNYDNEGIWGAFVPERNHQGYKGIVHGGIISTVLDEIMARMFIDRGLKIVTVKMEVRYRKPIVVGKRLVLRAEPLPGEGKFVYAQSKVMSAEGAVLATAKGTFAQV